MESRSATRGIFYIASDNLGLTFIAHCGSIQVLSKTGEHLRPFSVAGDNIVSASHPCGISIAGRYVYVTDEATHNILQKESL